MGLFSGILDVIGLGGGGGTTVSTTTVQQAKQDIAVTVNPTIGVQVTPQFELATTNKVDARSFIENIISTEGLTDAYAKYGESIERSQKSVADAIRSQSYATGEANYLEGERFSWLKETTAIAGERVGGIVTISVLLIGLWMYTRYVKN